MKKSNKRIPKSHLPKYSAGIKTPVTRTLANGNEVSYAEDNVDMGGGTQNIYNQKRSSGNNMGQYAGYAVAAGQTAANLAAINEQDYNGDTKAAYQSQAIGDGITQGMGALSPYIAMGTGIRKSATGMIGDKSGANRTVSNWMAAPHEAASSDIAAANNSENSQSQKIGGYMSAIGDITGMSKMRQMFSYGTGNDEKTTGFWGKYNDLSGISARNNQKNSLEENKFAMGGQNMNPTGVIEKQENISDPATGDFYQSNSGTHESGNDDPVNIPGGAMVFTDRFGPKGKKGPSWADLNKPNNTNREDKKLKDSSLSKASALSLHLTKMAKMKNSQNLFYNGQEAQKEEMASKAFDRTIKKYGLPPQLKNMLPQAQEAPEEGMQFAMGGKLPMYEDGGPVDSLGVRVNTLPSDSFKFSHKTGNKEVYVDPGNMQRAFEGSSKTKDVEGYNNFLRMKMASGISPDELVKQGYATTSGISNLKSSYNPKYVYMESFGKPSVTPTNTQMPYDQRIDRKEVSQNMSTDVNYYDYPDANAGYSKATRVAFDRNSGREIDPSKSYDPKGNYTPYFNLNTGRDLYKNTIKSSIPGTNPNNFNLNNQGDLRKEAIQSGNSFKYGGLKLPKYAYGDLTPEQQFVKAKFMGAEQNQKNLAFNQMVGKTPTPYQSSTNFDFAAADAKQQAEIDAVDNRKVTDPNDRNFDWGKLKMVGQDYGNFALQNAGNIYDLTRKQDPLQKYDRAKASFLDPSSAIRDALAQTRRAEYNVRNASGGNAGTYLANRVGLNAQNTENLARIHQNYANANAGIANQNSQFNTEIAYREAEAQAKDRAMRQNVNSQAVHSMASNFGKASKASKENSMDQKELDLFMYRYKNEPGFKEQVDKFRTA